MGVEKSGIGLVFMIIYTLPSSPSPLVSPRRLLVNARNAHRGPRNRPHTQSKSQKKSTQRRKTMFENPATAETLPARRLPTILVPEMHYTKHAATLQWVYFFFARSLSFCLLFT